jgi:hypothetical protein
VAAAGVAGPPRGAAAAPAAGTETERAKEKAMNVRVARPWAPRRTVMFSGVEKIVVAQGSSYVQLLDKHGRPIQELKIGRPFFAIDLQLDDDGAVT